ncbi:TonB-dependent receptor [Neisseria musculi]|uniref:TonB dependent receptor family protein n=1 Tax=Neisseria musculi TaxID=1815583 RepID=A0A7H1MF63_9NEIS|nr:TonB-dependent receptor [Neisseria musculi]QNT60278.1 tonB dependent receptor family protein [Neisseria musculi]
MQLCAPKSFRLSVLALALASGFAYADTEQAELNTVRVVGTAVPTRISRAQLDKEVATDLKQVMKDQIGINVGAGNGVAQYYSIRGQGEDNINLDVDNTSQSNKIFHHQSRFQLDPASVKTISVEKGTGSASAGIGATGGTVKVTTVDAKDLLLDGKPFGFKLGSTVSSNKGWSGNAAAYMYQNGFDALAAVNYLHNDDYKDGSGLKNTGSKLKQRSYLAKLGYDFNENHGIRLSYRQEDQKGSRTDKAEFMNINNFVSTGNGSQSKYKGFEGTEQKEETFNLAYRGRDVGFLSKIDANIFQIKTDDYKPPKGAPNDNEKSSRLELSQSKASGANLNLASELWNRHTLKYGVNYRRESSRPSDKSAWLNILGLYDRQDEKKTDYGMYIEGIWDWAPVTLTTGLRYDHFKFDSANRQSVSGGQFNPSAGVIWDVTPTFSLLGTLNQASRSPRLNEVLLANERAGAAADVDAGLKAETARRAEVGFRWRNDNFSVAGSLFQQNIKDVIAYQWAGISNSTGTINSRGRIFNGGRLKNHGYELDAVYRNGGLTARAGVSYVKPKIGGTLYDGSKLIDADNYESSFYFWNTGRQWLTSLAYRFAHPNLEIGWRGRYAQRVAYTSGSRAPYNKGHKAGYGVHDIFANWKPTGKDNLNINAGINNIGDKKYRSHGQRFSNDPTRISFYERGREYVLGVNYRF